MKRKRNAAWLVLIVAFALGVSTSSPVQAEPLFSSYVEWLEKSRRLQGQIKFDLYRISNAVKSQKIFFEDGAFIVSPYWAYPVFTRDQKKAIADLENIRETVIGDHFSFPTDDPNGADKEFSGNLLDEYISAMEVAAEYIEPLMVAEEEQPEIAIADYFYILVWMHRGEIALNMSILHMQSELASELGGETIFSHIIALGANIALYSRFSAQACIIEAIDGDLEGRCDLYLQHATEAFNESVDLFNRYAEWIDATFSEPSEARDAHSYVIGLWDDVLTSTEFVLNHVSEKPFNPSLLRKAKEGEAVLIDAGKWVPDDDLVQELQESISELPAVLGRDAGLTPN